MGKTNRAQIDLAVRAQRIAPVLFERNADLIFFSPCNPARQTQFVARDNKHKAFGDTHLGRNLYPGSREGEVADDAINRPAAKEFNPCGFRYAVAGCDPGFGHVQTIRTEYLSTNNQCFVNGK